MKKVSPSESKFESPNKPFGYLRQDRGKIIKQKPNDSLNRSK